VVSTKVLKKPSAGGSSRHFSNVYGLFALEYPSSHMKLSALASTVDMVTSPIQSQLPSKPSEPHVASCVANPASPSYARLAITTTFA
jgi:hypothetical protein